MLLAKIIHTLSEEEIARVKKDLHLAKRSRMLFDRIAASPTSPPRSKELCKELKITPENLYRLYSEISSECIRILGAKEQFSTLEFYRSKYLYQPFITELRRTEKEMLRTKDTNSLEAFYKYAFVNSSNFPATQMNLDVTQEFGEKWHLSKKDPPPDDDLYITTRVIYTRISALPTRKKMTLQQMSEKAQTLLAPIRNRAAKSANPLLRCVYYQSEWKSCMFDQHDQSKSIYWLRQCLEVIRNNKEKFPSELQEQIEIEIAYELALNWDKAAEGLEIFRKYYVDQTPDTPNGAIYLQRYIRIAFLAREYETAHRILKRFVEFQVVQVTPQIHTMARLMQAKLALAGGSLEEAQNAISLARLDMSDNFFLAYELQIRGLETILALKRGDLPFADTLVRRNIKWLHLRRLSLSKSSWIHYYNMIEAIINNKLAHQSIRPSLMKNFMTGFRTENPEFFILLEPEIAEAAALGKKRK
jgi:hypothetical protein